MLSFSTQQEVFEFALRARWLDRGADVSRQSLRAAEVSHFRWAEEAQGDEELLSMLRASAADRSRSWSGEREGLSENPRSGPFLVRQFRKYLRFSTGMCAAGIAVLFPTSGGADDQGRIVAAAWAALSGDLERLKDIFESDDCSIFIQHPGVEEANLPDVLEDWTLREYLELAFLVSDPASRVTDACAGPGMGTAA